jgi:hypothetical protein
VLESSDGPSQVTESSLALLDFPILRDNSATYKLKVRPILRNDTTAVLVITRLQWRADSNEVPFQPPFAYRFQVEKEQGSWRSDSWLSEELSVTVRPGWAFRFWVGLTSNFEDRDIRQRHHSGSVGKAIITMRVNDAEPAQDIEIQL